MLSGDTEIQSEIQREREGDTERDTERKRERSVAINELNRNRTLTTYE